jgi:2-polyprenyl-3-methyl-5-hydroxy-6-metoxy-1,4-benzoquinol methylase
MKPRANTEYEGLQALSHAEAFNQWMYSVIASYTKKNILEIGSGLGNISKIFIEKGAIITLSDIDEFYLNELKKKFEHFSNVNGYLSLDLQKKDFKKSYTDLIQKFDTVFLLNVLEHLEDDIYAIQNCNSLLKKSGTLIILVPAYSFLFSEMDKQLNHFRRYTAKQLVKKIAGEGFEVQKSFYFNAMGVPAWLYGKLRRHKKLPSGEMKLYNKLVPVGKVLDKLIFNRIGLSAIVVAVKK